jgi:molybdenum-dependent DNA-binding transcriptional regulator ModE
MPAKASESGRFRRGDAKLLLALASGASIRKAATAAGVSEATVTRRLEDPAFRRQLNLIRTQMVDRAVGRLAATMAVASTTLRRLLKAKSETVRLGAARAVLEMHVRLKEAGEVEERLAALEQQLTP